MCGVRGGDALGVKDVLSRIAGRVGAARIPPPSATPLRRAGAAALLDVDPRPLILSHQGIVVSWAPKSACSHVVLWFFLKEGLLPAARHYHPWPHKYRAEVYYRSQTHKRLAAGIRAGKGRGHTLLKVVRDPHKRLVSVFRHVCRHQNLRGAVDRKLGIDTERDGLSLREFDAFLSNEKLVVPSRMNMHVCAQHQPVWTLPFDRVVTINVDETDLNGALNAFEASVGLEQTDFSNIPALATLEKRHARESPYAGAEAIEDHRFRAADIVHFPKREFEETPLVRAMAARHYAADFGATASGDTSGRIRFAARAATAAPGGRPPVAAL
jgi:hypothetical protein